MYIDYVAEILPSGFIERMLFSSQIGFWLKIFSRYLLGLFSTEKQLGAENGSQNKKLFC